MKPHTGRDSGKIGFDLNPTYYSHMVLAVEMLPEGAKSIFAICKLMMDYVLSVFTIPIEVLLLDRWGTRALSLFQAMQVTLLLALAGASRDLPLTVFFLCAVILTWSRFAEARRGEWDRKPYRHSYTPGEPVVWSAIAKVLVNEGVPRGLFTEALIFRLWEPVTGIVVGLPLLLLPFTRFLGVVLVVMGFAFLIKRQVLHLRYIELLRDKADAEAVGKAMTETPETEEQIHLVRIAPIAVVPVTPASPNPAGPMKPSAKTRPTAVSSSPDPTRQKRRTPISKPGKSDPDPIRVVCGVCKSRIKCSGTQAGVTLPCPKCNSNLQIPAA